MSGNLLLWEQIPAKLRPHAAVPVAYVVHAAGAPRRAAPVFRPEVPALFLPGEGEPGRLQYRPMRVGIAADPDPGAADLDVEACQPDNGVQGLVDRLRVGVALTSRS